MRFPGNFLHHSRKNWIGNLFWLFSGLLLAIGEIAMLIVVGDFCHEGVSDINFLYISLVSFITIGDKLCFGEFDTCSMLFWVKSLFFSSGEVVSVGREGVFIVSIDKLSSCDQSMGLPPSNESGIRVNMGGGNWSSLSANSFGGVSCSNFEYWLSEYWVLYSSRIYFLQVLKMCPVDLQI